VALQAGPAHCAYPGAHRAEGWSFEDVLPVLKPLENTSTREDGFHGQTGSLPIRQGV